MPYGLKRYQQAESLHFITFSCYHRLPYLDTPNSKSTVEALLEQIRARHQARIYAYVLMPEHVHLFINEPPSILLGQFLKSFKQSVSRQLKGAREQFWQDRYHDKNIRGEEAFSEVVHYIHQNPVKRGLVTAPEQYRWTSYHHLATGVPGPVEIESAHTARLRENPLIAIKPR
jgi:putative transposase